VEYLPINLCYIWNLYLLLEILFGLWIYNILLYLSSDQLIDPLIHPSNHYSYLSMCQVLQGK
jgi:hypothetical protein